MLKTENKSIINIIISLKKKTNDFHNNSNILCIPARFISTKSQEKILDAFLGSTFEGGRHKTRVDKINS